jgi:crotonobetainyl-CoA:carnitine CoA-transferase CaiB-like acyl-CoA transferase
MASASTGSMGDEGGLLHGLRVLDVSLLGPAALAQQLADLGADVVKVEPPEGDHVRRVGWPIVEGSSLLHWHLNRGKRSIVLDLRKPSDVATFLQLVGQADVLVEGMRPGALERRGITWERLTHANPRLVFCSISGFGSIGPLRNLAMHGFGFDAWAAILSPEVDVQGNPIFPENFTSIGYFAGSLWGALGVLAGVLRARTTDKPCRLDISQAGAAAAATSLTLESVQYANQRNRTTTEPPLSVKGLRSSVRYNFYRTSDGVILVMMTERKFWQNFCAGVGRPDLFERWPGKSDPDHDHGNEDLRAELRALFETRSSDDWVRLGVSSNFPIIHAHSPETLLKDEHFIASVQWLPGDEHPIDMMAIPIRVIEESVPRTRRAPEVGEHTLEVLTEWLSAPGDSKSHAE